MVPVGVVVVVVGVVCLPSLAFASAGASAGLGLSLGSEAGAFNGTLAELTWGVLGAGVAGAAGAAGAAATTRRSGGGETLTSRTSTAPAVTIAAAAMPAAVLVASVEAPMPSRPLAPAPAPPAAAEPPAAAPPPAAVVVPRWARKSFLNSSSGPSGKTAASALLVSFSCARKAAQRSHAFTCRRAGAPRRLRPSATSPSSKRTSSHDICRASAASASETRARTRSDFTDGTVVSIASAIWS